MDQSTENPSDGTGTSVLQSAIYGLSSLCGIALVVEAPQPVQEETMAKLLFRLLPHILVGIGAILQGAAAFRRSSRRDKPT